MRLTLRFRLATPLGWPSARSRRKSIQATSRPRALAGIDRLIEGWRVSGDNPGRLAAARVLLVAEADLGLVEARGGREAMAETLVIGTVSCDAHFPASQFLAGSYESLRIRS